MGNTSSVGTAELVQAAALLRTDPVPESAGASFWTVFWTTPSSATVSLSPLFPHVVYDNHVFPSAALRAASV